MSCKYTESLHLSDTIQVLMRVSCVVMCEVTMSVYVIDKLSTTRQLSCKFVGEPVRLMPASKVSSNRRQIEVSEGAVKEGLMVSLMRYVKIHSLVCSAEQSA